VSARVRWRASSRRFTRSSGFARAPSSRLGGDKGLSPIRGAVIAVQRTSSALRLNPHVHAVFLDGAYEDQSDRVVFHPLAKLSTRDVAEVLEQAKKRMAKYLRRRGLLPPSCRTTTSRSWPASTRSLMPSSKKSRATAESPGAATTTVRAAMTVVRTAAAVAAAFRGCPTDRCRASSIPTTDVRSSP
jgi:hypothetical protein